MALLHSVCVIVDVRVNALVLSLLSETKTFQNGVLKPIWSLMAGHDLLIYIWHGLPNLESNNPNKGIRYVAFSRVLL